MDETALSGAVDRLPRADRGVDDFNDRSFWYDRDHRGAGVRIRTTSNAIIVGSRNERRADRITGRVIGKICRGR